MFKGKNIILGVTSSIAVYKSANVASALVKKGCNVNVLMTENATNFINPLTLRSLQSTNALLILLTEMFSIMLRIFLLL